MNITFDVDEVLNGANGLEFLVVVSALIIALLVIAARTLPNIRRDKQGRLYIYSHKYEQQKNSFKKIIDRLDIHETEDSLFRKELRAIDYKQSFYVETMPIEDRIISGIKYVQSGGNGETKNRVHALIDEHRDIYKTLVAMDRRLALEEV